MANSHAGRMIQHIYFGIELAISMGCRQILIKDGAEYVGFILAGSGKSLVHKNRVLHSLTAEDLNSELRSLNEHSEAVRRMYELVVGIARWKDGQDPDLEEVMHNPRKLREMMHSREEEPVSNIKREFLGLLENTKWRQTYWEVTADNLLRFLNAMSRSEDITEEPMYPHGEVFFNRVNNILEYLSVFGYQGPSIYHGRSNKSIARPEDNDPNLEMVGTKRAVPHIPFVKKGIVAAGMDWACVAKNKSFRYTPAKGKGPVAGFTDAKSRDGLVGNPQFEAFYASLRVWVHSKVKKDKLTKDKGKRRTNEDDEEMEENGSPPKKKRAISFL